MKSLIPALSLAFVLLVVPGLTWTAYGLNNAYAQSQLTSPSYRTIDYTQDQNQNQPKHKKHVKHHKKVHHAYRHDYDPYYGYRYPYYYDPYYYGYYPYTYYYEPGFSIDVPFFHFGIY